MLENQVALVTGGTAGIGKAIALALAKAGASVVLFGQNDKRGSEAVSEIEQMGKKAYFVQVDVSNKALVDAAIKKVLEEHGTVDILINNAGVTRDQLLMRMSEEDWDAVMDVNVKSCYNLTHALVRHFLKARKGKIVNISSVVGLTGNAGQVNYAASKAAVIGFTRALAKELAPRGICVNCVAPGFIETRMTEALTEEQTKATLAQIPLGRMGKPEEVAQAVLFLVGSDAHYMTGQVLTIDGGMVMA